MTSAASIDVAPPGVRSDSSLRERTRWSPYIITPSTRKGTSHNGEGYADVLVEVEEEEVGGPHSVGVCGEPVLGRVAAPAKIHSETLVSRET